MLIYIFILFMLVVFVGFNLGWDYAHQCIARECNRLGVFYVGNQTFRCIKITDNKEAP